MSIAELLKADEGKTLEFKQGLSSPRNLLKTLVAFANTAGGRIIIGVADKTRKPVGIDNPLDEEERLCNLIADSIAPRLVPNIEMTTVEWVSFDEMPMPELSVDDLDIKTAQEAFGTTAKLNEQALLTLKLLARHQNKAVPTKGGVLLFGRQRTQHFPDAWVQCGRFFGTEKIDIFDHIDIDVPLPKAVDEVMLFLKKHAYRGADLSEVRRIFTEARELGLPEPKIEEIGLRLRFTVYLAKPHRITADTSKARSEEQAVATTQQVTQQVTPQVTPSVYAYNQEDFGPDSLLGRGSDREVVLTRILREKLLALNPGLPPVACDEALRPVVATVASQPLVATNREKYALLRDGVQVTFRDDTGLPVDHYSDEEVQHRADEVYRHIYRAYPILPSPYYQAQSSVS